MKLKKVTSERSIGGKIFNNFILIILLMSIGFIFSLYEKKITAKNYDDYTNINIKLSTLSLEFSNSWGYFDMFIKTKDNSNIQKYNDSNNKIKNLLIEIQPYIEKDENSSIYLRNLNNMYDIYKTESYHLMSKVINLERLDPRSYDKLTEIKTLFTYITKHSESLLVSYMHYSNNEYSTSVQKYNNTERRIYIALIFIILVSFVFTMMISRDLNNTIGKLRSYAELLTEAKWGIPDLKEQKYEELNSLAKAFDKMKYSIREFIQELNEKAQIENSYNAEKLKNTQKDKLIKETQLAALQSQMDPHFLFNTLNTIARVAMFEDADQTVKLIEATSKILRYNLDCKDKMVELEEEIRMVKAYVIIQETRFQDQMSFIFNIDETLDTVKVPPMIVQPIVENAIIHGLREKDKGGIIHIAVVKDKNNFISISINDNGVGMDNEKIDLILSEAKNKSTGLGVFNVKKRLELYFNRSDLFKIKSERGEGTQVMISIPIDGGEDIDKTFNC
ncbi:sensor histidine kinase [Clostridium estertheticum]|uniref:sensor histidine kinase n=1 Tax=Clostridium estertheticum TaxID=238834 RepID=UPI001C6F2FAE|nr:sensor histidine kinase [Clostridium estertheticum]MBW9153658.1 histidine kinase [Clostridium estertheticum]WLC82985.1 histidine kinase [Clostridium estertheticum]